MISNKQLGRVKQIWYLSPMQAGKVQASLRIRAVLPEPPLLAHTSSESRGTFRQKARSLAPLNGWACAVKICHDGMLEDTNSLDAAQLSIYLIPFFSSPVRSTRRAIVVIPVVRFHTATKFYMQVFQKFISRQPLIRKHSYLDHRYPGGPAFIP